MALWKKVGELDPTSLGEITTLYHTQNIPIEVRDHCSAWIESSIRHLQPQGFITGLIKQLYDKLTSLNDPNKIKTPFYIIQRLNEFQVSLMTMSMDAEKGVELHKRFLTCLESERRIVAGLGQNYPINSPASVVPSCSTSATAPIAGTSQQSQMAYSPMENSMSPACSTMSCLEQSVDIPPPIEPYDPNTFTNNAMRILIDGEISNLYEAVEALEQCHTRLTFKCQEFQGYQALRNQQQSITGNPATINGMQQDIRELQSRIHEVRSEILQKVNELFGKAGEIGERVAAVLEYWIELKSELDSELSKWTPSQVQFANGKPMTMTLDKSQHIAGYLMEVAWQLRTRLVTANNIRQMNSNIFPEYQTGIDNTGISYNLNQVTIHIKTLAQDTFVLAHQPCQVLKTDTKLQLAPGASPMEAWLLVGEKLSLQLTRPSVSVCMIDEETAKEIESKGLADKQFRMLTAKAHPTPDSVRLDYSRETECLSAVFREVKLPKTISRRAKGNFGKENAESRVMDEKFCFLFRCEFAVDGVNFQVWRKSLPIVVVTHGSQFTPAWATVTWDNAFHIQNRLGFDVLDTVSWEEIKEVLNTKFTSMTGAPLTQENMDYLEEKLSNAFPEFPNLSWSNLCRTKLPGLNFNFWEWFYDGAKLIEEHLKYAWKTGLIRGFARREICETELCTGEYQPGTFLLRFSDSCKGAMSFVWLHPDGMARSINPFTSRELLINPLAIQLDKDELQFAFPNSLEKKVAFKKYFDDYAAAEKRRNSETKINGYVDVRTKQTIVNSNFPSWTQAIMETARNAEGNATQLPEQSSGDLPNMNEVINSNLERIINQLLNHSLPPFIADSLLSTMSPVHFSSGGTSNNDDGGSNSPTNEIGEINADSPEESFYMQL